MQKNNLWPNYKKCLAHIIVRKIILCCEKEQWFDIARWLPSLGVVQHVAGFDPVQVFLDSILTFFAAMRLRQYLLYLNRSKVATHMFFCEKK